jgi:hypothetical protein
VVFAIDVSYPTTIVTIFYLHRTPTSSPLRRPSNYSISTAAFGCILNEAQSSHKSDIAKMLRSSVYAKVKMEQENQEEADAFELKSAETCLRLLAGKLHSLGNPPDKMYQCQLLSLSLSHHESARIQSRRLTFSEQVRQQQEHIEKVVRKSADHKRRFEERLARHEHHLVERRYQAEAVLLQSVRFRAKSRAISALTLGLSSNG